VGATEREKVFAVHRRRLVERDAVLAGVAMVVLDSLGPWTSPWTSPRQPLALFTPLGSSWSILQTTVASRGALLPWVCLRVRVSPRWLQRWSAP
jgi:hypothetical protein